MRKSGEMPAPEAFEIPGKDGLAIRGERYLAESARGTVFVCHGFKGFAHWGFFPHLAQSIARGGLNAVTFDFSGSGIGSDRESFTEPEAFSTNTFSRELEDLENVVDYARRSKWIDERFGLFGHSRGGGTSILFAGADRTDVTALVTWAAISHVNRWTEEDALEWRRRGFREVVNSRTGETLLLGTDLLDEVDTHLNARLNMLAAARKVRAPWLIVHGTSDETVPHSEAEQLHEQSPVSTLRLIEGGNHGFGASHPLAEAPPVLDRVVRETVQFFVDHAAE
ncbi:MAG TPA: alpha/beta fold hydrolase [Gemmatimonadaceae bacterium]|nr:alpha/beta fold hydrolase [Gemmatimonadaceae bacterium]